MDIFSYMLGKKASNVVEASGSIDINANGIYNVKSYANAIVDVANSYQESDNGKVLVNGELIVQSTKNITELGTYDTTVNDQVVVDIEIPVIPLSALGVSF